MIWLSNKLKAKNVSSHEKLIGLYSVTVKGRTAGRVMLTSEVLSNELLAKKMSKSSQK